MADATVPAAEQPPQPSTAAAIQEPADGAATAAAADASGGGEGPATDDQRKHALAEGSDGEVISIKVVFGRQAVTTNRTLQSTVAELKADVATHTGERDGLGCACWSEWVSLGVG